MLKMLWRSFIGFFVGGFAGGALGTLAGFAIAMANYIANPPHGEDFTFAFTMAGYSVLGALTGIWTGLQVFS
jgi:hypothetical protein